MSQWKAVISLLTVTVMAVGIGTVIGTVVAPIQHSFYHGKKLLLVRAESPLDGSEAPEGTLLAA